MLAVTLLRSGKNHPLLKKLCYPSRTQVFYEKNLIQRTQSHYFLTNINQVLEENQKRCFHVSVARRDMEGAVKMVGAGIAATGVIGPGIGMGLIFGNMLVGVSRNPSVSNKLFQNAILGAALCESLGLFALLIAFLGAM